MNTDVINKVEVIKNTRQLSVRRGLVLGNGFSLLLISIITVNNMWEYFSPNSNSIDEFLILIFSSWGIAYVIFLWISFFVIAIRNIPGCGWTAIKYGLLKSGHVHICLDTVLNARQDMVQGKSGISVGLLARINDKIHSENDSQILYTKIVEALPKFTVQRWDPALRETSKRLDIFSNVLKNVKSSQFTEAKNINAELAGDLITFIEKFRKEFLGETEQKTKKPGEK